MKRIVLLFGILLSTVLWANAQSRFSAGVLLAPFSTYAGEPLDYDASIRYSTGISVGGVIHFGMTKKWSLTSGLWYENAAVKSSQGIFSGGSRSQSENLTLPLLINFRATEKKIAPYFSTGLLLTSKRQERELVAQYLLAAGLSYRISPQFSLNVQPAWTVGANGKYDRRTYPSTHQLSLQTQLLYHF